MRSASRILWSGTHEEGDSRTWMCRAWEWTRTSESRTAPDPGDASGPRGGVSAEPGLTESERNAPSAMTPPLDSDKHRHRHPQGRELDRPLRAALRRDATPGPSDGREGLRPVAVRRRDRGRLLRRLGGDALGATRSRPPDGGRRAARLHPHRGRQPREQGDATAVPQAGAPARGRTGAGRQRRPLASSRRDRHRQRGARSRPGPAHEPSGPPTGGDVAPLRMGPEPERGVRPGAGAVAARLPEGDHPRRRGPDQGPWEGRIGRVVRGA